MQSKPTFRRVIPVVAIVALAMLASCATNKKYGCPNHLQLPSVSSIFR